MLRLLALAALLIGAAALCEPFAGYPTVCQRLIPVGTQVWIAPNTTQAGTAAYLQSQVALIPLIEPPCNDPALAAGCLGVFRVCGSDDLPAPLCPSVCDDFVGNCTANPLVAPRLPNCSMEDLYAPGQSLYEFSRNNSLGLEEPCYSASAAVGCGDIGHPFAFNNKTGLCSITCPLPPLDDAKKNRRYTIMFRVTWPISMLCLIFLFVPWSLTFNKAAPFYPLFYIVSEIILQSGYGWPVFRSNIGDVVCKDKFTVRTQENDPGCWFQGALVHFGVVTAATSITALLYHVLNVIKADRYQIFGARGCIAAVKPFYGYLAFIFGVPAILVLVTSGYPGYSGHGGTACLPNVTKANRWPFDAVLEIPLIILWVLDVILGLMIFWSVYQMGNIRALRSQTRLIALCVYYWLVQGYGIGYLMYARVVQAELTSDITKYVMCTLGYPGPDGQPLFPPIDGSCRKWINPPADFWASWGTQVFADSSGIFAFFIFFHFGLLRFWWLLIRGRWRRGTTLYGSPPQQHSTSLNTDGSNSAQSRM